MNQGGYNERSWGIDLISYANRWLAGRSGSPISELGGERSLPSAGSSNLFPDVIVFGDEQFGTILQGWELKFPDTAVTDTELIANATEKAERFKTNSFLVWNVTSAVLYTRGQDGRFSPFRTWTELSDVRSRGDVLGARSRWESLLGTILSELIQLFQTGVIKPATLLDSLAGDGLVSLVTKLAPLVEAGLKLRSRADASFDAETTNWWYWASRSYPEADGDKWKALSRLVLTSWLSKLVFAHVLKSHYPCARAVESIDRTTDVASALEVLKTVTDGCDFRNVFGPQLGEDDLPQPVWDAIVQVNGFLSELNIEAVDPSFAQEVVQSVVAHSRNAAGQFATPYTLASLLARLVVGDKTADVMDPFCGSGTIGRAVYDLKVEYGVPKDQAIRSTWLSDKFSFPLQMAAMVMVDADNVDKVIQVFREDVVDLAVGKPIPLVNPADGSSVVRTLPSMASITSNLPFVQQEDLKHLNAGVESVNEVVLEMTDGECCLAGKSDLLAYLPFYVWRLLDRQGRLGVITSNAWLATDWGRAFREALSRFFTIDIVAISASGRWFSAADVVTTLLVLTKREAIAGRLPKPSMTESIRFVALEEPLRTLGDDIAPIAAAMSTAAGTHPAVSMEDYSLQEIATLESMGLGWNAFFGAVKWLEQLAGYLRPASDFFDINRGERRGWDAMFYPPVGHSIEPKFIRPVLKTIASVDGLVADVDAEAFCCMEDRGAMVAAGDNGALAWIDRFSAAVNQKGKALPDVLARAGLHWYSMPDSTMADFVAALNYDQRLFFARMRSRAFVNQRLTRFTRKNASVDSELLHALLNSAIGLLYLEMIGFGRGLGALDLSSTRMKDGLRVLDPDRVGVGERAIILAAFLPLLSRKVLPLSDELRSADRKAFDMAVFKAFGIEELLPSVYDSLERLFAIRYAVKD